MMRKDAISRGWLARGMDGALERTGSAGIELEFSLDHCYLLLLRVLQSRGMSVTIRLL